jgi:YgiT-type zinc finger domain-containing protein
MSDAIYTENEWPCFECDDGTLKVVRKPYETTGGEGKPLSVPDVPFLVCDTCGDELLDCNAQRIITEAREAAGVKYRR